MNGRLIRVLEWEQLAEAAEFKPANMAALCGVSLRQLQRFFQWQFRVTPRQWLRELQCRLAVELIVRGYSNVAVIAELKFASESHFCREFKRAHGVSPQTFAPVYSGVKLKSEGLGQLPLPMKFQGKRTTLPSQAR